MKVWSTKLLLLALGLAAPWPSQAADRVPDRGTVAPPIADSISDRELQTILRDYIDSASHP